MTISSEAVAETLRQAQEAVDRANVADDLRPAAFAAAFSVLSGGIAPAAERRETHPEPARTRAIGSGDSLLAKVATKFGVDEDALSYLYEEDDGDLRLAIRRNMLPNPSSRAAAMRDVAQLAMAGRQAAEIAEWTPYEQLRAECEELGVLDRANFATEIQTLDIRYRGGRRTREARLNRHGLDEAATLIRRMIDELGSSAASD